MRGGEKVTRLVGREGHGCWRVGLEPYSTNPHSHTLSAAKYSIPYYVGYQSGDSTSPTMWIPKGHRLFQYQIVRTEQPLRVAYKD